MLAVCTNGVSPLTRQLLKVVHHLKVVCRGALRERVGVPGGHCLSGVQPCPGASAEKVTKGVG